MSGHSKWSNIKHRKEKSDTQRAKIFTKIGREIAVIVKAGGPDPDTNGKLKDIMVKARANNMPNDNIQRCIKKAAGEGTSENYENLRYEGYGPSGVAIIVDTLTDNKNRTAGDMRHYFDKYGGNLGQTGCVSFMFDKKGQIIIEKGDIDIDDIMMEALSAGAEDILDEDEVAVIVTDPDEFGAVCDNMSKYTFASAEITMIPKTNTTLNNELDIKNMNKLMEMLMDNDDVQDVYHNCDNELDN